MKTALLLLLLAPTAKEWSKAHGIGVLVPSQWKVTARDQGGQAFRIVGPNLGPGKPTVAIHFAGFAAKQNLRQKADDLAAAVSKRPGWRVVAKVRKQIGPYPAMRLGIAFDDEGRKGRARVTLLLMGGCYYVLEMNAAASHFPAARFDAFEKSLEVRHEKHTLKMGPTLEVPRGWDFDEDEQGRVTIHGPTLGSGPAYVRIAAGRLPDSMLAKTKPGPKLSFLGDKRPTQVRELDMGKDKRVRMLHLHFDGITVQVMIPTSTWEDIFPAAKAMLASVKRPKSQKH